MIIIGAGSTGLFLALKKAELEQKSGNNERITVYEDHKILGSPVQCTGILTDDIEKLLPENEVRRLTMNRITRATIFSPNRKIELKMKDNAIIDNVAFVQHLADRAEKNGVRIETEKRFLDNQKNEVRLKDLKTGNISTFKTDELIGADGPTSAVALHNGLLGERKHLLGMQASVKIKDLDRNNIDFYPYIGEYAWCTPESDEVARVGVAVPLKDEGNKNKMFEDFLKRYPGTILEKQGGLIPLHSPNMKLTNIHADFAVALVGDAAMQTKNTTGGGIIAGMKAALVLSKGIDDYRKNLKPLNKELYMHYLLNKAFHNYKPNDWDRILRKANSEKIKNILLDVNRDNVRQMIFRLALHPSMISEGLIALGKMR